ncbi:putative T7SS-secreted protein [Actinosynnema sp. NPDC023658]|uniref:putative T7SS-secreted protein n=1 Tax=Actinosynnema sp. NPDC023658 TaxID=3155465 RepID=UPI0033FD111F
MAARLGETDDPKALVPGEPELITGDLRQLVTTLRAVVAVGADLGRVDAGGWSGGASDAFRSAFDAEPPRWLRAGEDLGAGGQLLADYGDALVNSQREAQRAIELYLQAQAATRLAAAEHDAMVLSGTPTAPFQNPGRSGAAEAQKVLGDARSGLAGIGDVVAKALGWESDGKGGYKKSFGKKKFGAAYRETDEDGEDTGGWQYGVDGRSYERKSGSESKRLLTEALGEVAEKLGIDLHERDWAKNGHVDVEHGEKDGDFHAGPLTGHGRVGGSVLGAEAGATATASYAGVTVGAHAGAYLASGHAEGEVKLGQHVGVSGSADGTIGVAGEVKGTIGPLGAKGRAEAFAGAKVSGEAGAEVAGIGAGVNGEAWAGIGAQASGQFGLGEDGKFHVGGSVGAAFGVGGKVGFDVTVDPVEVVETVVDVADDVGEIAQDVGRGVGHAAENAGRAIGRLFGR